jgi:hypothetical protein
MTPFVIFALPRSRTAWLSKFLSYRDWTCGHEQIRYFRNLDDIKSWLAKEKTGTVETAGASFWRLLQKYRPDARVAVIWRPVDEVVDSLMRTGVRFDKAVLTEAMKRGEAKLEQVAARWPDCLWIKYHHMGSAHTCRKIFSHCLPYQWDREWWLEHAEENIQVSLPAFMRYVDANIKQINALALQSKNVMLDDITRNRPCLFSQR